MVDERNVDAAMVAPAAQEEGASSGESEAGTPWGVSLGALAAAAARGSAYLMAAAYISGFIVVTASRGRAHLPPTNALDIRHFAAGMLFLLTLAQCAAIAWGWHEALDQARRSGFSEWGRRSLSEAAGLARLMPPLGWLLVRHLGSVIADIRRRGPVYESLRGLARKGVRLMSTSARLLVAGTGALVLLLVPLASSSVLWSQNLLVDELPFGSRMLVTAAFNALVSLALFGTVAVYRHYQRLGCGRVRVAAVSVHIAGQVLLACCVLAAAFGFGMYRTVKSEFGGGSQVKVVVCLDPKAQLPPSMHDALRLGKGRASTTVLGRLVDTGDELVVIHPEGSATPVTVPQRYVASIIYGSDDELKRLAAGQSRPAR